MESTLFHSLWVFIQIAVIGLGIFGTVGFLYMLEKMGEK